jgi:hypothetical protein
MTDHIPDKSSNQKAMITLRKNTVLRQGGISIHADRCSF